MALLSILLFSEAEAVMYALEVSLPFAKGICRLLCCNKGKHNVYEIIVRSDSLCTSKSINWKNFEGKY